MLDHLFFGHNQKYIKHTKEKDFIYIPMKVSMATKLEGGGGDYGLVSRPIVKEFFLGFPK